MGRGVRDVSEGLVASSRVKSSSFRCIRDGRQQNLQAGDKSAQTL